jgi:hypothetical protein
LGRSATTIVLYAVAAVFVIAAVGFLGATVYLSLASVMLAIWAALATAGLALLVAGLVVVTTKLIARHRTRRAARLGQLAVEIESVVGPAIETFARARPVSALLIALCAGLAVGLNPGLIADLASFLGRDRIPRPSPCPTCPLALIYPVTSMCPMCPFGRPGFGGGRGGGSNEGRRARGRSQGLVGH